MKEWENYTMKLICKNNEPIKIIEGFYMPVSLTLKKEYEVLDKRDKEYFILDDFRTERWIPKEYFEI